MAAPEVQDRTRALLRTLADRIDATDPGACNNLGVLYYAKGLHAEAVGSLLRALALAPRMRVAARNLAVAAAHPGACDAPIAALEARLATDPADRAARRELARLHRLIGRPVDAHAHLDRLLADDPDDAIALREAGLLEQAGGDLRTAQRWLERALAVAPDDTCARLHLAEVLYHRGGTGHALRQLDTLLAQDDGIADAHQLRSFVLGDLGRPAAAAEASRRARALDPALVALQADLSLEPPRTPLSGAPAGSIPAIPITRGLAETPAIAGIISNQSLARYSLGLAFRQRGYFTESRRELERAHAHGEDPLLVEHALAELDLVQGAHADARRRYLALIAERGDDARLWNELGVARHQGGDVAGAAEDYRRALRLDPRHALALNNRGVALADLGEREAARDALQRAVHLDPSLARARLNLACWHQRSRDPLGALAVLRDLVTVHPRLADGWHAMGRALLALDRVEQAREALARAVEHDPTHAEARYALAEVLGSLGDHDGALRETQHALALAPVRVDPRLTVGIALHEECPASVGRLDLLALVAAEPLAGATVDDAELEALLPVRGAEPPATHTAAHDAAADAAARVAALDGRLDDAEARLARVAVGTSGSAALTLTDAQAVLAECTAAVRAVRPWLEARALQVIGDAFAALGVHGEAHERYAQVRVLAATDAPWTREADAQAVVRRALLGEVRSACLLGRGAEAVPLMERFGSHDRDDPDVLALLAATHAALGDAHGARVVTKAIRRLLRIEPRSAALLHFVGDAAAELGDDALAIALHRRALALDPTRPSPRVAIAQLLQARGDLLAAHLELLAALVAAPGWREATCALAALHRAAGRPADAVRVLAAHLERNAGDADAFVLLAEALHEDGRDDDARVAVQRARRLEPDHLVGLWMDGTLHATQGRVRVARARWSRIIALAPGAPLAARARTALAALDEELGSVALAGAVADGAATR